MVRGGDQGCFILGGGCGQLSRTHEAIEEESAGGIGDVRPVRVAEGVVVTGAGSRNAALGLIVLREDVTVAVIELVDFERQGVHLAVGGEVFNDERITRSGDPPCFAVLERAGFPVGTREFGQQRLRVNLDLRPKGQVHVSNVTSDVFGAFGNHLHAPECPAGYVDPSSIPGIDLDITGYCEAKRHRIEAFVFFEQCSMIKGGKVDLIQGDPVNGVPLREGHRFVPRFDRLHEVLGVVPLYGDSLAIVVPELLGNCGSSCDKGTTQRG